MREPPARIVAHTAATGQAIVADGSFQPVVVDLATGEQRLLPASTRRPNQFTVINMDASQPANPSQPDRTEHVDVRPLEATDAAAYIELLNKLDQETRFLLWEPGERAIHAEDIRKQLASNDISSTLRLVASCDGRLVGFLVSRRGPLQRTRHRADFAMAVLASHQRQSIGTRLLHELETWAEEGGIERLELTVMSHNHGARMLYEQHGFVLEGVKRNAIRAAGEPIDECIMGKLLTRRRASES